MATSQTQPMRLEPKTFFANERTFLSWLHMAVTLGSISAALLGFAAGKRPWVLSLTTLRCCQYQEMTQSCTACTAEFENTIVALQGKQAILPIPWTA